MGEEPRRAEIPGTGRAGKRPGISACDGVAGLNNLHCLPTLDRSNLEFAGLDTAKAARHSLAVLVCWAAAIFGVADDRTRRRLAAAAGPICGRVLDVVEDRRDHIEEFDDAGATVFAQLLQAVALRPGA